jgi:hypothetical protein
MLLALAVALVILCEVTEILTVWQSAASLTVVVTVFLVCHRYYPKKYF